MKFFPDHGPFRHSCFVDIHGGVGPDRIHGVRRSPDLSSQTLLDIDGQPAPNEDAVRVALAVAVVLGVDDDAALTGILVGVVFRKPEVPVDQFFVFFIVRIEPKQVQAARERGFSPTCDFSRIADMDAVIICVPTPLDEFRQPDMSYIVKTAESIAPYLHAGQLVILESTTYPGTTEEVLVPILEKGNKHGLKAARNGRSGDDVFYVAFSPEREDPGRTDVERHDIPKVIGGLDATAGELAAAVYGTIFRRTVRVSTPAVKWLVPVSYVSHTCLVRGGHCFPREYALFAAFRAIPPPAIIIVPNCTPRSSTNLK